MWYNGGMGTSDWINLIAAILIGGGTLALAVMTWKSIQQTRNIQKSEKRHRLLDEIIEWATDIAKCGLEKDLPDTSRITDMNDGKLHLASSTQILARSFQSMRGRNQYINKIVSTFGQDLQEATNSLIKDVEEHIKLLDILYSVVTVKFVSVTNNNIAEYTSQIGKSTTQIAMNKWRLDDSANKVIEEAVKIRTEI